MKLGLLVIYNSVWPFQQYRNDIHHYLGLLIRPSADMYDEAAKLTCAEDDELSIRESFRGFTPTPMDIDRR